MRKNFSILITLLCLGLSKLQGQSVNYSITDQTNTAKLLSVRPNYVFGIGYFDKNFYVGTNLDAQYWYKELFDARFGVTIGSFTGVSFGGTYHLSDQANQGGHKFVTSQSTSGNRTTTKYFIGKASSRTIYGPCLDVRIGKLGKNANDAKGFFELNAGINLQRFCRVYADVGEESYPSNKNGWFDLKAYAIFAHRENNNGVGLAAGLMAARRPWKAVTMYLSMQLGFLKTFGGGAQPILSPGFGLSVNLIKKKGT